METIVEVNGRTVLSNGFFAYDNCHKIYVTEDEEDLKSAKEIGYDVYPIAELEETYEKSCPLKFISNWKLTEQYAEQGEQALINTIDSY